MPTSKSSATLTARRKAAQRAEALRARHKASVLTPGQWDSLPAAVADLRQQGLSLVEIAARLGVKIHEVKEADRARRQPNHGTLARWRAGCRCDACSEAAQKDPLTLQVAELRAEGKSIASIAGELGISQSKAARAALAAGSTGRHKVHPHGSPARRNDGCRCAVCMEAIRNDPFVAEVGRLHGSGLNYKEIAERLEVPYWRVPIAGHQAEALRLPVVHWTDRPGEAPEKGQPKPDPEAIRAALVGEEPLVIEVGALHGTGLAYEEIAERLEVPYADVQAAGDRAESLLLPVVYAPDDAHGATGVDGQAEPGHPRPSGPSAGFDRATEYALGLARSPGRDPFHGMGWPEWERHVAAARDLRRAGLSYSRIGERLGVSAETARDACTDAGVAGPLEYPRHGTMARLITGCDCPICTEARENDPTIAAAAELRRRDVTYRKIGELLGITASRARDAVIAAGFSPMAESPKQRQREARADAVKLMRDRGLAYSQIGEALGVSEQTARKIGHELGFRGQPPVSLRVMTEEEEKRAAAVRRLRTKGLSYREIGEQLGISEHAAQKIGHELGFRGRPERPERPSKAEDLTSEQRGEIIVKAVGLRLKGMTYAKIGRRLGVPGPVVATVCRDAGFTD